MGIERFSAEQRVLILATIYQDEVVREYLEKIDYENLSEEKLLTALEHDNYKIRNLFII